MNLHRSAPLLVVLAASGCGAPATPRDQALQGTKTFIDANIAGVLASAEALCAAAPAGGAAGWDKTADRAAIDAMKSHWRDARIAYESIEGAIAVLFPDLDISTDQRYDGFIAVAPDSKLFDDTGVTGIHAIERILWSDVIPPRVVRFESGLAGYQAARFPETQGEAADFKNKLCARLVRDLQSMQAEFVPLALDPAAAYRGLIGSMREQVEKADKAATGEEESRYAEFTLADMRTNVAAGVSIYGAFKPWLESVDKGAASEPPIDAGFARVQAAYAKLPGDALPPVPDDWSSLRPTPANLATDFGKLWTVLQTESDPGVDSSLVAAMSRSADLLGIAQLQ